MYRCFLAIVVLLAGSYAALGEGLNYPAGDAALTPVYMAGDVDRDNDVDIFDFLILRSNYGQGSDMSWTDGDLDGDGDVDIYDFLILRSNYGLSYGEIVGFELGDCPDMILTKIPAGSFTMGSPESEFARENDEGPQHSVTLTEDFYMGIYEVTQAQYESVMESNPSHFIASGPDAPVEKVSWGDAVAFCNQLSTNTGLTIMLPSEAQWEYACRAGSQTSYCFGDDAADFGDYAWFNGNSGGVTHPVGQKKPNAFGLYDMYGNVFEWCLDWYGNYSGEAVSDPTGPLSGYYRVLRGGCFGDVSGNCRSAERDLYYADMRSEYHGFRIIIPVVSVP